MGKIFCIMGKSATGKDTIYESLLGDAELQLKRIIPYTTRPIRDGEEEGREYHFVTQEGMQQLDAKGLIIEKRLYNTVHGPWYYFTVNDENIELESKSYFLIQTLEGYVKLRDYFGADCVVPIYVEIEDGERLMRALSREINQDIPKYEEMCRRFLADAKDFSEENLKAAGITERFENVVLQNSIAQIKKYIQKHM